ncbi:MAG: hypothetical protein ISR78_02255 [Spirochaetia bacterium]|nr:hypothetical protein [Spirochaetia bacterium]
MNNRSVLINGMKIIIILMVAVWGVIGSYHVITSEVMQYPIIAQLEQDFHDSTSTELVGRGNGGTGRGRGGGGGKGHSFTAAPDALNRYINYAGMFALIILIVYWLQKYTLYRKKVKKVNLIKSAHLTAHLTD